MQRIAGQPAVFKGTADTTLADVPLVNPVTKQVSFAFDVAIKNMGDTNALYIYVNELDFVTAEASGGTVTVEGPVHRLAVKAAASTTDYQILASVM